MTRTFLMPSIAAIALILTGCGGGNETPTAEITAPAAGETVPTLTVNFSGRGEDPENADLTYSWSFGDGGSASGAAPVHTYSRGGEYTVALTVTDDADQTDTAEIAIRVNDPPQAVASIQTPDSDGAAVKFASGQAPLELGFDATRSGDRDGALSSVQWDFGDGTTSAEQQPTHVFEQPGEYTVTLTVTDGSGVSAQDTITVEVAEGAGASASGSTTNAEGGTVHTVRMLTEGSENVFEPAFLRVQPGDTVRWVNESGVHATASYSADNQKARGVPNDAATWDSGLLTEAGAVFEHTFETAGTYAYFCLPHEALGMVGVVVVGDDVEPDLSQDFLNGLPEAARAEFAKQLGLGTGGAAYTVEMGADNAFSPAVLRVSPGDTIRWVNAGEVGHTTTAYHPDLYGKALGIPQGAQSWDSGILNAGESWSYTVPEDAPAGTYAYFCLPHESLGMVGLIVVGEYRPLSEQFTGTLPEQARARFQTLMQEAQQSE